jgi:hypothetical protein
MQAICHKCGTHFTGEYKKTFLGFHQLGCPNCKATVTYPLSSKVRLFYALMFALGIALLVYLVFWEHFVITGPGLIGCAILFALLKDLYVRYRVSKTAQRSPASSS